MSHALSSIRKCYYTPWTDLLRGRMNGRLDWRAEVSRADLPAEISVLVSSVAGSRGLWPAERASIARELVNHFLDGQARGNSFEDLKTGFGDPKVAAQLIRKSKERNRPMLLKLCKAIAVFFALMLAMTVMFAGYLLSGVANPQEDYLAVLNENAAASEPEQRAWPIYRDAWIEHSFPESKTPIVDDSGTLLTPDAINYQEAVAFIEESSKLLDAFREGARLPALGLELEHNIANYSEDDRKALFPNWVPRPVAEDEFDGLVMGVLLPHVQTFRRCARMLRLEARLAAQKGDSQRVFENIETQFGFGNQIAENPVLVCGLVAMAVEGIGYDMIEETLMQHPELLTDKQLLRLQEILSSRELGDFIRIEGERAIGYDLFQHIFTDDGNGNGRITREGVGMIVGVVPALSGANSEEETSTIDDTKKYLRLMMASRKETTDAYDRMLDFIETAFDSAPYQVPLSFENALETSVVQGSAQETIIRPLTKGCNSVRATLEKYRLRKNGMELAIAITRFERANDRLPEKLDELVPDFIDAIPEDRFRIGSLNYLVVDDKPVIYSVGSDRDDDGGREPADGNGGPLYEVAAKRGEVDGDFVLWPWLDQ